MSARKIHFKKNCNPYFKWDDENKVIDNKIIPLYATGTLNIQFIWPGCSMGNSRKKNSGRGDMEFPAVIKKKKKCNFQELSENKLEFLKVAKKK